MAHHGADVSLWEVLDGLNIENNSERQLDTSSTSSCNEDDVTWAALPDLLLEKVVLLVCFFFL